jgi:hypothetical protein
VRIAALLAVSLARPLGTPAGRSARPTVCPRQGFEAKEGKSKPPVTAERRNDALARAKVWREPAGPIAGMDLKENPAGPHAFATSDEVICKFHPRKTGGHTPKFQCVFSGGEVLKVKYGDREVHSEVAATRLLAALGAGADRMYLVQKVRCFGCPKDPHAMLTCLSSPFAAVRRQCQPQYATSTASGKVAVAVDYASYVDFTLVAIERRADGRTLEAREDQGWGWDELDRVASSGGASAAERDALRLLAVFLNDWDNRAENQRLICVSGGGSSDGRCGHPFAYMHDVGASFGGRVSSLRGGSTEGKLDVERWRAAPIWKDAQTCRVSMTSGMLNGATFGEATISDSGRRFLAARLGQLTEKQIRDLFEGSRVADSPGATPESRDVERWVHTFQDKVRQITERPPCPSP